MVKHPVVKHVNPAPPKATPKAGPPPQQQSDRPSSWRGWPITYLSQDRGGFGGGTYYGSVTCYDGTKPSNIFIYPAAIRDGRTLDVIKHEWVHTAECRDGEPDFGSLYSERVADAGALEQGARYTYYTRTPTQAERNYAHYLLTHY